MEFVQIDIDALAAKYLAGSSLRSLAKEYGTSKITIRNKLLKRGIDVRNSSNQMHYSWQRHKESSKPTSDLTEENLCELWNKISLEAISQRTGATIQRIKRLAKKLALPAYQQPKWKRQTHWDNYEWLYKQYEINQKSLNAIAKETNSTPETIKSKLIQYGIAIRSLQQSIDSWNAKPESIEIRRQASKKILDPEYSI